MNHQLEVKKTIEITASLMEVWHALTDQETIKKYFFGTTAISDWEEGSSLIFKGEWEGKTYEDKGTILNLKQKGFAGEEALAHAEEGWTMVLQNLKDLLEG